MNQGGLSDGPTGTNGIPNRPRRVEARAAGDPPPTTSRAQRLLAREPAPAGMVATGIGVTSASGISNSRTNPGVPRTVRTGTFDPGATSVTSAVSSALAHAQAI